MDHLILSRRPNFVLINKKKKNCGFVVPADEKV